MTELLSSGATTLNGAIDASQTSITVSNGSAFPAVANGDTLRIQVESEIMRCTAHTAASTTLTVVRGQEGTTGASHSSGKDVLAIVSAAGLGAVRSDIGHVRRSGTENSHVSLTSDSSAQTIIIDCKPSSGSAYFSLGLPHAAGQRTTVQRYGDSGRVLVLPSSGLLNGASEGFFVDDSASFVSDGTNLFCDDIPEQRVRGIYGTSHKEYSLRSLVWSDAGNGSQPTFTAAAMCAVNGQGFATETTSAVMLSAATTGGTWTSKTADTVSRAYHGLAQHAASVFSLGGLVSGTPNATLYEYSVSGNSWSSKTSAAAARWYTLFVPCVLQGELFAIRGFDTVAVNTVYRYTVSGNSWATRTAAPTARFVLGGSLVSHRAAMPTNMDSNAATEEYDFALDVHTSRATIGVTADSVLSISGKLSVGNLTAMSAGTAKVWNRPMLTWLSTVGINYSATGNAAGATV